MNHSRLTLTLPPTLGSEIVEVDAKRFSIGRTPENDLVIEDTSLSRRHALIENFEGRFNLSDCGSSNGTFINGNSITGSTELSDWDVLTFGGVGDILVRIDSGTLASGVQLSGVRPAGSVRTLAKPIAPRNQSWLSGPVIAVGSAVIIILVTVIALLIGHNSNSPGGSKPVITKKTPPVIDNENEASTPNVSVPSPGIGESSPINSGSPESNELSMIE